MEITSSFVAARFDTLAGPERAAAPNAAATAQFAALMQAPASEPISVAAVPAPPALDAVPGAPGPSSIGDRILTGMQDVSSEFRENWTRVTDTLRADGPQLGMQEMLSLQLHMTQASVQIDLLGKLVSRSTQNIDQLVRVQ